MQWKRKQFLKKFAKENEDPTDVTRAWIENESKIKQDKMGMYSMTTISPPYSFEAAMLCGLFGKPDSTKFSQEWMSLIDAALNATLINWAQIFFDNFVKDIMAYTRKMSRSLRVYPHFL